MMSLVSVLLAIVFFANLSFATILVVNRNRKNGAGYYAIAAFATTLWVLAEFFFFSLPPDNLVTQIAGRILYLSGLIFAPFFLFFTYEFLKGKSDTRTTNNIELAIPAVLLAVVIIFSDKIVGNVIFLDGINTIFIGSFYPLYILTVGLYFTVGLINLIEKYNRFRQGSTERRQLITIFLGLIPSIFFGMTFNVVLPYFGSFDLFVLGPLLVVFYTGFTTAAILRFQIFNVKVIATNLLVFVLWSLLLARVLLWETLRGLITDSVILIVSIPVGILLVRSVLNEVQSRERIEHLADELAGANKQLQALSRQKTEFLSMASHQFRSPLTAIKGYSSLILEGSFGPMSDKVRGAVDKVFQSSQLLVSVIDDFLNISRIELGKLKFRFEVTDLGEIIRGTIESQKPAIEKTGLGFKLDIDDSDFTTTIDAEKIRQVTLNLLDNALKYTTKGTVTASLRRAGDSIMFAIADTGAGITPENIGALFEKFNRADAASVGTNGTGLGLYIAKKIIDAHGGKIWAESEGKGKGSTFKVELMAGEQKSLLDQNLNETK